MTYVLDHLVAGRRVAIGETYTAYDQADKAIRRLAALERYRSLRMLRIPTKEGNQQ